MNQHFVTPLIHRDQAMRHGETHINASLLNMASAPVDDNVQLPQVVEKLRYLPVLDIPWQTLLIGGVRSQHETRAAAD